MQILIRHSEDQLKVHHLSSLFTDNNVYNNQQTVICTCADPESFARGGPTLTTFFYIILLFFLVEKSGVKYHYKGIIVGSPAKRQYC